MFMGIFPLSKIFLVLSSTQIPQLRIKVRVNNSLTVKPKGTNYAVLELNFKLILFFVHLDY